MFAVKAPKAAKIFNVEAPWRTKKCLLLKPSRGLKKQISTFAYTNQKIPGQATLSAVDSLRLQG
jgi:hypothetical protein